MAEIRTFTCFTCKKEYEAPFDREKLTEEICSILGPQTKAILDDDILLRLQSCDDCMKPFRDAAKAARKKIDEVVFNVLKKAKDQADAN